MPDTSSFKVTTRGDREIVLTRVFDVPRDFVYEAFTKPELVKQWLLTNAENRRGTVLGRRWN